MSLTPKGVMITDPVLVRTLRSIFPSSSLQSGKARQHLMPEFLGRTAPTTTRPHMRQRVDAFVSTCTRHVSERRREAELDRGKDEFI